MGNSPDEFARRIDAIADNIPEAVHAIVRKAALMVDQAVVVATPVDTGRAKSNWLATIGAPSSAALTEAFYPGKWGSTRSSNEQTAISGAAAVISRYGADDSSIFIANNLHYIGYLNAGSSRQAQAGYVERQLALVRSMIRGSSVLIRRVR